MAKCISGLRFSCLVAVVALTGQAWTDGGIAGRVLDPQGRSVAEATVHFFAGTSDAEFAHVTTDGGSSGDKDTLYITAGTGGGKHGLIASIQANP
jgi:hypothetical protein